MDVSFVDVKGSQKDHNFRHPPGEKKRKKTDIEPAQDLVPVDDTSGCRAGSMFVFRRGVAPCVGGGCLSKSANHKAPLVTQHQGGSAHGEM